MDPNPFTLRSSDGRAGDPAASTISLSPPPREARLRFRVKVWATVITTAVVGLAVVLLLLAMDHGRALERLRDDGVLTGGTVDELKISRSRRSKNYTISYRFGHDGIVDHGSDTVSSTTFERYSIGDPIPVTYERADPSNNQLFTVGAREVSKFWTTVSIAGAAFAVIAAFAAACSATVYSRRLSLLRDGEVVAATIVKIGSLRRKSKDRKVEFSIPAPTGEVLTKKHWMEEGVIEPGQEGQTTDYLLHPFHPKRGEPVAKVLGSCEVV
jgi:cytochrome c-type biogenesis protein CcmE